MTIFSLNLILHKLAIYSAVPLKLMQGSLKELI